MSEPISKEMQNQIRESGPDSEWVKVKDESGRIQITKENPFIGRLLKHEYVEADNPQYGNDEGKKHILTWFTRKEGEKKEVKQSTTSNWFMQKLMKAHDVADTWDFKWWYEQQGEKKTVPFVKPFEKEEPEPEPSEGVSDFEAGKNPDDEEEVSVEDIPF